MNEENSVASGDDKWVLCRVYGRGLKKDRKNETHIPLQLSERYEVSDRGQFRHAKHKRLLRLHLVKGIPYVKIGGKLRNARRLMWDSFNPYDPALNDMHGYDPRFTVASQSADPLDLRLCVLERREWNRRQGKPNQKLLEHFQRRRDEWHSSHQKINGQWYRKNG